MKINRIFFLLVLALIVIFSGSADSRQLLQLRVLTYNIHHGEGMDGRFDYERLAKVILSEKPDVVAVQEVDRKTQRASGVDQAELLGKLTGMNSAYGRAMYYSGGEYGEAILSRFPIGEAKFHPLPFTTGREPRTALVAQIKPDNGLPEFLFAGTHLCHQSEELRTDQARQINSLLPETGEMPVILAGDLNSRTGSSTMQELLDKRWIDATKTISRIDYILLRPNDPWQVVEVKNIEERVASDHLPVLAVLEWTGNVE
ncbi:MAG: endonuclease [Candidatus Omnitrophota bacterium]|jgi:endonuclease/exonuclease/phosphatase family metal-dependent hydrolase|nr:MAG: endonuclease [Candidatus Omnitrophota bacterium]